MARPTPLVVCSIRLAANAADPNITATAKESTCALARGS